MNKNLFLSLVMSSALLLVVGCDWIQRNPIPDNPYPTPPPPQGSNTTHNAQALTSIPENQPAFMYVPNSKPNPPPPPPTSPPLSSSQSNGQTTGVAILVGNPPNGVIIEGLCVPTSELKVEKGPGCPLSCASPNPPGCPAAAQKEHYHAAKGDTAKSFSGKTVKDVHDTNKEHCGFGVVGSLASCTGENK